jgi:phage baseplate assembly protein W
MIDDVNGTAYPFRIDPATGGVAWASGREKIRQNLRIILGTRVGERPMLRNFGTQFASLVHDPNDGVLAELAVLQGKQILMQWEPRILVTDAKVEQVDAMLQLSVIYVHTQEPVTGQLIIPLS